MFESMKDAQRLADQILKKHDKQVIRMTQLVLTAARLCPLTGHDMHELMNECALAYCEANDISVDAVNACIKDVETAESTIMELVKLEVGDMQPSQGNGVGSDFFSRFGKGH